MDETHISVTLAARNFSECINRVRYQGVSFLLEKNGVPVARIIPVWPSFSAEFEQLATALRQVRKTPSANSLEILDADEGPASFDTGSKERLGISPRRPKLNW
jgi:antitoxin (DNA-binding transcriptional repressor) of toxin-antitoxin stability system